MATHSQVAHAWAHQTGKQRKGFAMYYEGPTIYSWGNHWPLAQIVTAPDGRTTVLAVKSSRTRSVSTRQHFTQAIRACSHIRTFEVDALPSALASHTDEIITHANNWEGMCAEAADQVAKASRARKYGRFHLDNATHLLQQANLYNEAFQLGFRTATIEGLEGIAREMTDRALAMAERANADRAATKRRNDIATFHRTKEQLRDWLKGDRMAHLFMATSKAYCRVKGDTVETSLGAVVPLRHAMVAFKMAAAARRGHTEIVPDMVLRIGHFKLDRIDALGGLHIGCHYIPWQCAKLAADLAGIKL